MARKKKAKAKSLSKDIIEPPKTLPQNIVLIGEHSDFDRIVYISQDVYKEIQKFTKNKTVNESGGVLIGKVLNELGKENIIIYAFVEAKHCEATPTTLTFTHETWESIHNEVEKNYPSGKIVGWIHTHPNYGIFLSEYDKFIQNNFFNENYQVAYVVDPIQKTEGFYLWINGIIENSKGFFIFDKTGTAIEIDKQDNNSEEKNKSSSSFSSGSNLIVIIMAIVIVLLAIFCVVLNSNISQLKANQQSLENLLKENNNQIRGEMYYYQSELESLKSIVGVTSANKEEIPDDQKGTEKTINTKESVSSTSEETSNE